MHPVQEEAGELRGGDDLIVTRLDVGSAGEAFADASYYSGRPFDAMEQLKQLLKRDDLDYYARARIQARIAELTPLVLELEKRRVKTPDNPAATSQLRGGGNCTDRVCVGLDAADGTPAWGPAAAGGAPR